MTGFRPKRFDVAGAHPDEAYRAVSNIAEVVQEWRDGMRKAGFVDKEADVKIDHWLRSKPLRFGNSRDWEVQRFLSRGVNLMDDMYTLGFSQKQFEVRCRCEELATSMQKVLDKRPDEQPPFDPWRPVKIRVETGPAREQLRVLTAGETRDRYLLALRGVFPRGPAQAHRSRGAYHGWEENAERLGNNPPVPEAAKPWQRFVGVIENMKLRDQAKGIVWGRVDDVAGIDFKPALTPRPAWQSRPRMRM